MSNPIMRLVTRGKVKSGRSKRVVERTRLIGTDIFRAKVDMPERAVILGSGPRGIPFHEQIPEGAYVIGLNRASLIPHENLAEQKNWNIEFAVAMAVMGDSRVIKKPWWVLEREFTGIRAYTAPIAHASIGFQRETNPYKKYTFRLCSGIFADGEEFTPGDKALRNVGSIAGPAMFIAYLCGVKEIILCGVDLYGLTDYRGNECEPNKKGSYEDKRKDWWQPRDNIDKQIRWMRAQGISVKSLSETALTEVEIMSNPIMALVTGARKKKKKKAKDAPGIPPVAKSKRGGAPKVQVKIPKYTGIKYRWDIINDLIRKCGYKRYLEVGVCGHDFEGNKLPGMAFTRIKCDSKDGVDPAGSPANFHMSSDEFFAICDLNRKLDKEIQDVFYSKIPAGETNQAEIPHKWDIIFIDGDHSYEQSMKDFKNALKCLSKGGTIVMHDSNFDAKRYAGDGHTLGGQGTVWKTITDIRCSRKDVRVYTVNIDSGVSIIRRGRVKPYLKAKLATCLGFDYFQKHREEIINLISVEEYEVIKWT